MNKVYFCNLFKVEPSSTYYNNKNAQLNKYYLYSLVNSHGSAWQYYSGHYICARLKFYIYWTLLSLVNTLNIRLSLVKTLNTRLSLVICASLKFYFTLLWSDLRNGQRLWLCPTLAIKTKLLPLQTNVAWVLLSLHDSSQTLQDCNFFADNISSNIRCTYALKHTFYNLWVFL